MFRQSGCPQLPVCGERTPGAGESIIGMLSYREMMQAYGRELLRRRED